MENNSDDDPWQMQHKISLMRMSTYTLYAKLSPVSTRGHQSQLGHMTQWESRCAYPMRQVMFVLHCVWTLQCRPSLFTHTWKKRFVTLAYFVAPKATGWIMHHLTTVVYLIYKVMWSLRKIHTLYSLLESDCTLLLLGLINCTWMKQHPLIHTYIVFLFYESQSTCK